MIKKNSLPATAKHIPYSADNLKWKPSFSCLSCALKLHINVIFYFSEIKRQVSALILLTRCQRKECGEYSIICWRWMFIHSRHLFCLSQDLNGTLKSLLSEWFSVGLLRLERITWHSLILSLPSHPLFIPLSAPV